MFPLLLLLFLTSVAFGEPEANPKIKLPACGTSRKCFVPKYCVNPSDTSSALDRISESSELVSDCVAIARFRAYSNKKWLMILESRDPKVEKIALEQGKIKFECAIVDSKAEASFRSNGQTTDEKKDMLSSSISPLMCEFIVKTDADVLSDAMTAVALSIVRSGLPPVKFSILALLFKAYAIPTCDPDDVTTTEGADGEKMILKTVEKINSMDLECPEGYNMTYRDEGKFETTSSIHCKENDHGKYGYSLIKASGDEKFYSAPFEARCERPKCLMCSDTPPKSPCAPASKFKVELENGCKKLTCIKGRIQLGNIKKLHEHANCSYINDNHVYAIEGEVISNDSNADCVEALECDEKLSEKLCPDCVVDAKHQPRCSNGFTLTIDKYAREVVVTCNAIEGKLYIAYANEQERAFPLMEIHKLSCTMPKPPPPPPPPEKNITYSQAQMDELTEEARSPWKIGVWILCGINAVLLVLVCMAAAHFQEELAAQKNKALRKMRKKLKELEPKDLTLDDSRMSKIEEPSVPSEYNRPLNSISGKPVTPMESPELKTKTDPKQATGVGSVAKKD